MEGSDNLAKRRPNGDGMVRKRKDGRWEGRMIAGHKSDGKPVYKSVLAKTQKELISKLNRLKESLDGVELTGEGQTTLSEWLDIWMAEFKSKTLRRSTFGSYETVIEKHIKPTLGKKSLSRITESDVQKLYNGKKEKEGLSSSSVRTIHLILHQAMQTAQRRGMITCDPTSAAVLPKRETTCKTVLQKQQIRVLLDSFKEDPVWCDFFKTELMTGMRRGEICGLKWCDFDNCSGALHVCRTIRYEKGELIVGETKTSEGNRVIMLPDSIKETLVKRRNYVNDEWIFPNPFVRGVPVNPQSAYNRLQRALRETGLPHIRFHDLRHTFATMAAANGVDPRTLAGVLGHTNASFTLDVYTHVTTEMQKNAAKITEDYVADILGGI